VSWHEGLSNIFLQQTQQGTNQPWTHDLIWPPVLTDPATSAACDKTREPNGGAWVGADSLVGLPCSVSDSHGGIRIGQGRGSNLTSKSSFEMPKHIKLLVERRVLPGLLGSQQHDHSCNYEVVIQILLYSKCLGKHAKTHLQFDMIRKLQSAYSNQMRALPQSNMKARSLGDSKGNYQYFSQDSCRSFGSIVL
jgi:hypothetical protein